MGYSVILRFYEELNDFIKNYPCKEDILFSFRDRRSVKDLIESFGVPHTEVDLILVNGESVNFNYIVEDGDRISIYPVFEQMNITGLTRLRAIPLRQTRFVLDVHLGTLARKLRLLGFDCDYRNNRDDPELAEISSNQKRVLLTRDRGLLKRKIVTRGMIIRNDDPQKQLAEVLDRLDIRDQISPFSRCPACNGLLAALPRTGPLFEELKSHIPPGILKRYAEFSYCRSCRKVFWKGSHYDSMVKRFQSM